MSVFYVIIQGLANYLMGQIKPRTVLYGLQAKYDFYSFKSLFKRSKYSYFLLLTIASLDLIFYLYLFILLY